MCEPLSQKANKMDTHEFHPQTYSLALSFKHCIFTLGVQETFNVL